MKSVFVSAEETATGRGNPTTAAVSKTQSNRFSGTSLFRWRDRETATSIRYAYGSVYSTTELCLEEDTLTFAEWQQLGLDSNSTMLPGRNGKPTGTKVFVFPNKYAKGRANVAVFNWDGKDTVVVDLSGALAKGQKYVVYNCLDIRQTIERAKPVHQSGGNHSIQNSGNGNPTDLVRREKPGFSFWCVR